MKIPQTSAKRVVTDMWVDGYFYSRNDTLGQQREEEYVLYTWAGGLHQCSSYSVLKFFRIINFIFRPPVLPISPPPWLPPRMTWLPRLSQSQSQSQRLNQSQRQSPAMNMDQTLWTQSQRASPQSSLNQNQNQELELSWASASSLCWQPWLPPACCRPVPWVDKGCSRIFMFQSILLEHPCTAIIFILQIIIHHSYSLLLGTEDAWEGEHVFRKFKIVPSSAPGTNLV